MQLDFSFLFPEPASKLLAEVRQAALGKQSTCHQPSISRTNKITSRAFHATISFSTHRLSTQVYKWEPANCFGVQNDKTPGGDLRWTSTPSRGNRNTPSHFRLQKPEISATVSVHIKVLLSLPNSDLSQTSHCNTKVLSVSDVVRIENMTTQIKLY